MFADITFTITTTVIHEIALTVIGFAAGFLAVIAIQEKASKKS